MTPSDLNTFEILLIVLIAFTTLLTLGISWLQVRIFSEQEKIVLKIDGMTTKLVATAERAGHAEGSKEEADIQTQKAVVVATEQAVVLAKETATIVGKPKDVVRPVVREKKTAKKIPAKKAAVKKWKPRSTK